MGFNVINDKRRVDISGQMTYYRCLSYKDDKLILACTNMNIYLNKGYNLYVVILGRNIEQSSLDSNSKQYNVC